MKLKRILKTCFFIITLIVYVAGCGAIQETAPTVLSTNPPSNATNVAVNSTITASFSQAINPSTISTDTFTLMQGTTAITGAVSYSTGTATFTPSSSLAKNTTYTATITTGVMNVNGNALSGTYTWSFTTTTGVGTEFPVAATSAGEFSVSSAFGGTNIMVGVKVGGSPDTQSAQLISQSGALVGSSIPTGSTGGTPLVGFNGTNYLTVWSDANNVINGQLIDTSGNPVGFSFPISVTLGAMTLSPQGISCDSTQCAVVWHDTSTGIGYTRAVSPTGTFLTSEQAVTGAVTDVSIASDGTNYLVAWDTGTEIHGSIASKSGMNFNTNFVIAAKSQGACTNHNPVGVAFDGTNYLVVWNDHSDCATAPASDVLAQFVDTVGTPIPSASPFKINSVNTSRAGRPSIAFDGTNYLVAWTDGRNDANKNGACDTGEGTCDDIYGQYVSKSGALAGSELVISKDAGNQTGFVTGFNAGEYLVMINTGVSRDSQGILLGGDVYGVFVTP